MNHRTTIFAVVGTALLLFAAVGPAAATDGSLSVGVEQADAGDVTVTVTHNGTAVENASVDVAVESDNVTYEGAGSYVTDENGTVSLPAPSENVTVSVTATSDGATASTTATLVAADDEEDGEENDDAFGQEMSSFVHELLDSNETEGGIGSAVASYAVENNPSNGTAANAGPPEWLVNESVDKGPGDKGPADGQGPPDDKGSSDGQGPPDDKGPSDDDDDDEETEDGE